MSLLPPSIPTTLWPRQQVQESEEKVEESERREKEEPKIPDVVEIGNLAWWLAIGMVVVMTWYGT